MLNLKQLELNNAKSNHDRKIAEKNLLIKQLGSEIEMMKE